MTRPIVTDDILDAVLRERAGAGAPGDLQAGIMAAIASERRLGRPHDRPDRSRVIRLLAVAAVVGTTVGAAVLAGAGRTPVQPLVTPSAATAPSVVIEPSVAPSSSLTPQPSVPPTAPPSSLTPPPSVPPTPLVVHTLTGLPALAIGPNGKAIAIEDDGRIVVARQNQGIDSVLLLTTFEASGRFDADASDAKIIVADHPWVPSRKAFAITDEGTAVALHDHGEAGFEVIRYRSDGSVDESFGDAGHVRSAFGDQGPEPVYGTSAMDLAIGSDGSVFVVGGSGDDIEDDRDDAQFAIAKFTRDGVADAAFGADGQVFLDIRDGADIARTIGIQDDGRLVVVGETGRFMAGLDPHAVVRLLPDGTPDPGFGTDGTVLMDFCCASFSVATLGDGSSMVVGRGGQGATHGGVLARYLPNGSPDPTFDNDGILESPIHFTAVAVQPDGRIVVASIDGGLWRYLPDGTSDGTFDNGAGWP